ncbi:anionic antimicrobial peptide 2-like [Helicoverpa zea]|uniref:anionic antimicrobial peptide 2-like n=1 Tax=Helicoverpa zea TaxID=7113 RepID=UPI001F564A32|nr:anionic antimicrobial peptide 2-like [Helicoverpa zea]
MNKLLIVLVAVCLVSAQAFVKRDAPADNKNYLETLQKQIQEFGQSFNTQVSNAFDPDTIKKNFNQFVDGVTKTMNDMKAATEPKKA